MKCNFIFLLLLLLILSCESASKKGEDRTISQLGSEEDYSSYLPEIRTYNSAKAVIHEPDTTIKTTLRPYVMKISGPVGEIGMRIFKPDTIKAVVMDIHGGGWEGGMAEFDDVFNDEMARTCQVAIVSIDYHVVTPETPFPACLIDCKTAAKWLINNAKSSFGTEKLIISAGSAGAHLAALTTVFIRDSLNAINRVKGVNLMYGAYDLSRTPSNRMASDTAYLINRNVLDYLYKEGAFRDWSVEELQDPQYSPLFADLRNLPPALFTVGTADPLVDDTFFMEARWKLAGNKTSLAVYPECPHAFNYLPIKIANVANTKIFQWINDIYAP